MSSTQFNLHSIYFNMVSTQFNIHSTFFAGKLHQRRGKRCVPNGALRETCISAAGNAVCPTVLCAQRCPSCLTCAFLTMDTYTSRTASAGNTSRGICGICGERVAHLRVGEWAPLASGICEWANGRHSRRLPRGLNLPPRHASGPQSASRRHASICRNAGSRNLARIK
jgi:hypothetical protein